MTTLRRASALGLAALVLAGACRPRSQGEVAPRGEVLPAPSTAPRYAIAVADPDEVALLQQQLRLTRVVATRESMTFEADSSALARLRELGYRVTTVDPEVVDTRVVRVRHRGSEERLRDAGVIVISREKGYWIVSGPLGKLRALARAGYLLEPIGPDEPRPRAIRVRVSDSLDVQRVANLQVDIHSVADSGGHHIISAGALDIQIDRLREAGFTVDVLPSP